MTKLKNSHCEKTQKLKLWQNSKTQIVATQKLNFWQNSKTQIVTKLKIKLWQCSKTQMVTKLKHSNSDKTLWVFEFCHTSTPWQPTNSQCSYSQFLRCFLLLWFNISSSSVIDFLPRVWGSYLSGLRGFRWCWEEKPIPQKAPLDFVTLEMIAIYIIGDNI